MCINMFEYVSIRKPVSLDLIMLFSSAETSFNVVISVRAEIREPDNNITVAHLR